ncbi:MAG TPA: hypothetical protein DFR83_03885, partial [Deltaproteobacteria bacterium]|nr:hypothetical protein [Deltaproteobacteria bacterium]
WAFSFAVTPVEEEVGCPSLDFSEAPAFGVGTYGDYGTFLFLQVDEGSWTALGSVTVDGDGFSGRIYEAYGMYEQYDVIYEYLRYTDVSGTAYR